MKQVYVIDFGDRVKVGITDNIERRIYQIQCSAGAKAIRFTSVQGDQSLEHKVQRKLSEYHIAGEFFSCSFDFSCLVLGECCGAPITPEQIFFPDIKMPLRIGRPKAENPKQSRFSIRLDAETEKRLHLYCEEHKITKGEAVRRGIHLLLELEK